MKRLAAVVVTAFFWMMMTMDHCSLQHHHRHHSSSVEAYNYNSLSRKISHSRNNVGGQTNHLVELLQHRGIPLSSSISITTATTGVTAGSKGSLVSLYGQNSNDMHEKNNDDDNNENNGDDDWSLQQDWAILDNVSKFTVESGVGSTTNNNNYDTIRGECRTFWMQLGTSIPILSRKTPEELYRRCQELVKSQSSKNGKDIKFGPSPPLLQHWQLLDSDESSCNQAVGQLSSTGQTIWIKYHCLGRLANDPFFSDMSTTATSSMSVFNLYSTLGGGYIETIDGRIYELGIPSPRQAFNNDDESNNSMKRKKKRVHYQSETYLKASNPYSAFYNEDETRDNRADDTSITLKTLESLFKNNDTDDPWPWMPATTATMSALLASTVLSACIGYGAGLGIIADSNHSPSTSASIPATSMLTTRAADSSQQQQQALKQPSMEELKARSEYRILKEQRMIQNLEYKMAQEQKALQNLNQMILMDQQQQQQSQQQNPNLGGPSSSSSSSLLP